MSIICSNTTNATATLTISRPPNDVFRITVQFNVTAANQFGLGPPSDIRNGSIYGEIKVCPF